MTRPPSRIRPIEDGDVLPVLGGLRVVHTPGHTPGSVCLGLPGGRGGFRGDVEFIVGAPIVFDSDTEATVATRRLEEAVAAL